MSKNDFLTYFKGYFAKVKKHLTEKKPDRVDAFQKGVQDFVKNLFGKFEDYIL